VAEILAVAEAEPDCPTCPDSTSLEGRFGGADKADAFRAYLAGLAVDAEEAGAEVAGLYQFLSDNFIEFTPFYEDVGISVSYRWARISSTQTRLTVRYMRRGQ